MIMIMIVIVFIFTFISASGITVSVKLGLGFQSHYSESNNIIMRWKPLENVPIFPFHQQMKWQEKTLLIPKVLCKCTPQPR